MSPKLEAYVWKLFWTTFTHKSFGPRILSGNVPALGWCKTNDFNLPIMQKWCILHIPTYFYLAKLVYFNFTQMILSKAWIINIWKTHNKKKFLRFQVLPVVSQSSENVSGESNDNHEKKNGKKPVAPPRSSKDKNQAGVGGIKGSKSSFNLEPRPSSGRPSSSRPGR